MQCLCLLVVPCCMPVLVGLGVGTADFPTQGSPMHWVVQGYMQTCEGQERSSQEM